jgi:hypothetical protein
MAYQTADLQALDAAIATGELSVQVDGRRIQYRSIEELLKARAHVASQISSASAGANRRGVYRFTMTTARGD